MKMNKQTVKYILIVLFALGAIADIYSTLRYKNMIVLETNIIYVVGGGIIGVILAKVLVVVIVSLGLKYIHLSKKPLLEYSLIFFIFIAIFLQFNVALHNHSVHQRIAEYEGYDNPADVPVEAMEKYIGTPKNKLSSYFKIVFAPLLIPYTASLLAFETWRYLWNS